MLLAIIFILYHQWTVLYSLFGRHSLFSVFMPITLDTVHMYIIPMKCLVDSLKYFTLVTHICSFIPDTLSVSFFGSHICFLCTNAYEVFTAIHKHFTFYSRTCSFTSMTTYEFLACQTYFFSLFIPVSFETVHMCIYTKYICKSYLFFHIYDPLGIPFLAVIIHFWKCLWSFYCNS